MTVPPIAPVAPVALAPHDLPSDDTPVGSAVFRHRQAAMVREYDAVREAARVQQERERLIGELESLPPDEPEPDAGREAWAQAGAMLALAVGAEVSVQAMIGDSLWARLAAFVAGMALASGLGGAVWNTHVARQSFWRPLAWSWLAVWLTCLLVGLGWQGLTSVATLGAGPMLLVSLFAGAVAFFASMAAAHHVDAVAERHARMASRTARLEAINRRLGELDSRAVQVRPNARG